MPGLVPGIHVFFPSQKQVVDGRDEPGHDERGAVLREVSWK
jgi:hydroxymethylglutaryl-CoA lyase